jgi:hypothetical protein
MRDETLESRLEERKRLMQEKAKEYRRKAYERAKNSPAALARKEKMKEMRRAAYQRSKELRKAREAERRRQEEQQIEADRTQKDRALLEFLMAGSELTEEQRPRLRLIRGEKQ